MSREVAKEAAFFAASDLRGFDYFIKPVSVDEFVLSKAYLDLRDTIRPAVLKDLNELFCDEKEFAYCPYEEAVFDEAIGSGKSYKTSIIIAYYLYHLLCLENPQRCFNLDRSSLIAIMNMSINAMQAKKVVFGEVRNRIINSKWFGTYQPDPSILSELRFPKNISIICGHSGEFYPLGYNLICAVMDEAAFYTETDTHDVAAEMFYTLKRRIKTRFGKHGLLIMISSPRYVDDFIERKAEEAKNDKAIFCRRRAIWEVIPEDVRSVEQGDTFEIEGTKIPSRYKKDFDKNPEKAWRDLGARPSMTLEPYIKQWTMVERCIKPDLKHPFGPDKRLIPEFKGVPGKNYYAHIDLGLTHDACGIALGHVEGMKIRLDLMHKVSPVEDQEIDIAEIVNLLKELRERGFKLKSVTYDQFQSASSIQQLNKMGITAGRLSVEGLEAYETLKEAIYQDTIEYYRYEPFLAELKRLELIKGKKIDHPPKGSKDVADAVAGVVYGLVQHEVGRKMMTVSML